ncbi:MAG: hypothetical protein ACO2PL_08895 [Armatimonadota bacterium]
MSYGVSGIDFTEFAEAPTRMLKDTCQAFPQRKSLPVSRNA